MKVGPFAILFGRGVVLLVAWSWALSWSWRGVKVTKLGPSTRRRRMYW